MKEKRNVQKKIKSDFLLFSILTITRSYRLTRSNITQHVITNFRVTIWYKYHEDPVKYVNHLPINSPCFTLQGFQYSCLCDRGKNITYRGHMVLWGSGRIMVRILYGNSEICAHVRSNLCYFSFLKNLISSWAVTNRYHEKKTENYRYIH